MYKRQVLSGVMEDDQGTIANWLKDNRAYVTYSSDVDLSLIHI